MLTKKHICKIKFEKTPYKIDYTINSGYLYWEIRKFCVANNIIIKKVKIRELGETSYIKIYSTYEEKELLIYYMIKGLNEVIDLVFLKR